ncbi:MAG: efflux RND transporter periplasmic adaptor subunit [Sulfurovaceae bacterium]|nr:efflux RND transporter periplasmic adaptor subunit [Sulfurovaceae bacterium]
MSTKTNKNNKRNKVLIAAAAIFIIIGLSLWLYQHFIGQYNENTDNAYVQGDVYSITPQTSGIVSNVYVQETQNVKKGDILVKLDDRDAMIALDKAEANLALSVRNFVKSHKDIESADDAVTIAQKDLDQANADLARRKDLVSMGALSKEEYDHINKTAQNAKETLSIKKKAKESLQALMGDDTLDNDPNIKLATNAVQEAYLNLKRCDIISPCNGVVAKKSVQEGQRLSIGQNIMAIVGNEQMWVDANFKETQLTNIRIGQDAKVNVDIFGAKETFRAKVIGISPGTGASFSILPAQNASGNWIKIVQRIPVRLALNPKDIANKQLRVGLSSEVDVDTHDRSGGMLSMANNNANSNTIVPYANASIEAKKIIEKIINENK